MSYGYQQTPFDQGFGHAQNGYSQQPQQNWGQQSGSPEPDIGGFDPNDFPDGRVADGTYRFVITDTAMVPTKAGTGFFLKVTAELQTGQSLAMRFNIKNPNSEAERIAKQELAKLVRGVGLQLLRSHRDLVGQKGTVTVSHRTDKRGQEQENYRFENPATSQAASGMPAQMPQQVPASQPVHPVHPGQPNPAGMHMGQPQTPAAPPVQAQPPQPQAGHPHQFGQAPTVHAAPTQPAFAPGQSPAPWNGQRETPF